MLKIIDNTDKFIMQLKSNNTKALNEVGRFCKNKMDELAAVDTGYMKSRNKYEVSNDQLILSNDTDYAVHQEYGTYKMKAHPFMRPSAFNYINDIKRILLTDLKV